MSADPHAVELVILPGLDGTGNLGRRLHARLRGARLLTYPRDRVLSFDELDALVQAAVGSSRQLVLIGESYSGAVALRYAATHRQQVKGVVMVAGFISPPWTSALAHVMWTWLFRVRPPRWTVRWLFAGWEADDAMIDYVTAAVRSVRPEVISGRLRQVLTTDHTSAIQGLDVPVLYIAGAKDRLVKRGSMERVCDVLPQTVVRTIVGPHVLSETHPEEVAAAIETFITRLSGVP